MFTFTREDLSADAINHALLYEELREALGIDIILDSTWDYGLLSGGSVSIQNGAEFNPEQRLAIQDVLRNHNPALKDARTLQAEGATSIIQPDSLDMTRAAILDAKDIDSLKAQNLVLLDMIEALKTKIGG